MFGKTTVNESMLTGPLLTLRTFEEEKEDEEDEEGKWDVERKKKRMKIMHSYCVYINV